MDLAEIREWGRAKMQHSDEAPLERGYRYYHGLRTAQIALSLGEGSKLAFDPDILFVGAFLHDVGKAAYNGPNHGARGEDMVRREIPHLFRQVELDAVAHIIRYHYTRPHSRFLAGQPMPVLSVEALLVQDADTLDHFGGNALWLSFRWSMAHGRNPSETVEFYRQQDALWRQDALTGMNFELGKRELEARIARTDRFFALWEIEEQGKLTGLCSI